MIIPKKPQNMIVFNQKNQNNDKSNNQKNINSQRLSNNSIHIAQYKNESYRLNRDFFDKLNKQLLK